MLGVMSILASLANTIWIWWGQFDYLVLGVEG